MRNVWDKSCRGNQNTYFMFSNFFFFRKSCSLWDNVEKYCRTGQSEMTIWRTRIACTVTTAKSTHSQYVKFTAFFLQEWLHERASALGLCMHCMSCFFCFELVFYSVSGCESCSSPKHIRIWNESFFSCEPHIPASHSPYKTFYNSLLPSFVYPVVKCKAVP